MSDSICHALLAGGQAQVCAISAKNLVSRMREIHQCSRVATAALGRQIMMTAMMGSRLKNADDRVSTIIKGDGCAGSMVCTSLPGGVVRGYVQNPHVTLLEKYRGKLDVGAAVGTDGMLTVIRDLQMKEPYVGSVELVSGEIAEDITNYFAQSEQIPTACALGVLVDVDQSVKVAGGYLVQLLPGAPDSVIDRIESGIQDTGAVTAALDKGMTPQQILESVLPDFELEFLEEDPVAYQCYCSRDRVTATLISLGRKELEQIVADGEDITIECQFCDARYRFTPDEIRQILAEL